MVWIGPILIKTDLHGLEIAHLKRMKQAFLFLITCFCLSAFAQNGTGLIPAFGMGIGDNSIHQDSSFSSSATAILAGGENAKILSRSSKQHDDNSQKQLFYWYQIETASGKVGWVYGDGFAIPEQKKLLPINLQKFQNTTQDFGNGFSDMKMWFGVISGRDLGSSSNFMGSYYLETYLILTATNGKSLYVPLSGESFFGKTIVDHFEISEVNGNNQPEIIVQKTTQDIERNIASQWVDIYAIQGGSLTKVFGEALSGQNDIFQGDMHLEIDNGFIRTHRLALGQDKSIVKLVEETWYWNPTSKVYEIIYPQNTAVLPAKTNRSNISFRSTIQGGAQTFLSENTTTYIQGWEKTAGGIWKVKVLTKSGQLGYLYQNDLNQDFFAHNDWLVKQLKQEPSKGPLYDLVQIQK